MAKNFIGINVETLVLVAIWETPFIFQGCFKIKELDKDNSVLFFFRCQTSHGQQLDILNYEFSPEYYEFSHLYNEAGLIKLSDLNEAQSNALYLLKYALHKTLGEMLSSRKTHFTSIDDTAMRALIAKVKPILNQELALPEEDYIGFAVAMDFCPQEDVALVAALTLLGGLKDPRAAQIHTH